MDSDAFRHKESPKGQEMFNASKLGQFLPLEVVVQRAFDACIMIDEAQIIIDLSPKAYQLFQYEPETLLGQSLEILIPPSLRGKHQQHVRDFLVQQDTTRLMQERLRLIHGRRRDGSLFPLEAVIAKGALPDKPNHFVMGVFLRDVTEREQRLQDIERSAQFSQGVLDSQPAHICVLDEQGVIVAVNESWRAFARENGADPDKVGVGNNYLTVSETAVGEYADEGMAVAQGIRAVIRGEQKQFTFQYPCHSPNEERWYVLHVKQLAGADVKRILVVHENVTHLKQTERAFLQAQKSESLSLFAASIAHDFNNMLTAITTQSSLGLLQSHRPDAVERLFGSILQVGEQAAKITKQLMDFAGNRQGAVKLIDLNMVLEESLPLLQVAVSSTISLDVQLTNQATTILADTGQVQQIIMNLVLNAAEAYENRFGVIQLQTEWVGRQSLPRSKFQAPDEKLAKQYVCLRVTDQGQGMDAATQARVFDPFFTTKDTGHGLGLAAVQGIVHRLNGFIELTSRPGQGTTFEVYLPYVRGDKSITEPLSEETVIGNEGGLILLVDDEDMIRTATAEYLEIMSYRVVVAADGAAAVRQFEARSAEFVLAILDVMMPEMSGYEVYNHLHAVRPDLPIVIVSGYDNTDRTDILDKDNVLFVTKPYRLEKLMAAIFRLLSSS